MYGWTDKVISLFYHEVKLVLVVEELIGEKHFSHLFSSMFSSHFDDAAKSVNSGLSYLKEEQRYPKNCYENSGLFI
jgi:hypothetical protein